MEHYLARRSTATFLLLLFLVLGILGTLILVRERQELRKKAVAQATLELIPRDKEVNQGEEFTLDVVISTASNQVTSADLTLTYDAAYLDGLTIQNGSFLPEEFIAGINQNGIANIGLRTNEADPRQGQNQLLATLRFQARNPIDSTAITFDEANTRVLAVGQVMVPISTTGSTVRIIRTVTPDTTLRFDPSQTTAGAGQDFSVNVRINSGNNEVTVVDVVIDYDAEFVEGVSFTQTNLLPRLLRNGTNANGTARITLGSSETQGFQGEGVLGVLTFRGRSAGSSALTFSGQTRVTALGTDENMFREGQTGEVTVTGAVQPTPTPVGAPTPTPSSDGTGGTQGSPPTTPTGCTRSTPLAPTNLRASIPGPGKVTLAWGESVNATHYGIVYGRSPGRYEFGAANVGYTTSYTVGNLAAGTTYYFAVFAVNDCAPSGYSNEVAAKTQSTGTGGVRLASPGSRTGTIPVASPPESPSPGFVALPKEKGEVIPFLAGRGRVAPSLVPELPGLTIPPESEEPPSRSPLLTPLGGLLLIMVALFLGIFFLRMRSN